MTNFLLLVEGGGGCHMNRVSMNISHKYLWTTDKWCSFSWGIGWRPYISLLHTYMLPKSCGAVGWDGLGSMEWL